MHRCNMFVKLMAFVLAAIMTLALLSACSDPSDKPDETTPDGGATTTPAEIEEDSLSIIANGASEYRIVRNDDSAQIVTDAASTLRAALEQKYNMTSFPITSDFEMAGTDPATRHPYEILVGATNRDESTAALNSIKYNDFIITVSGTRVVIIGGSDEKTVEAVNYFIDNMLTDGSLVLSSKNTYHQKGEYLYENATLMGVKLSEYTIVYQNAYRSIANIVANEFGERCGTVLNIATDSTDPVDNEIIIGNTNRGNTKTYTTDYDYSVITADGKVYIGGRNSNAVGTGCRALLNLIKDADGADVPASAININYTLPDREDYINNIDLLAMPWAIYMDTPEWMLDFEEKTAAMRDVDGRLMSCLHRSDMVYFPENSIEGIISAIKMGGDMIEIDPRITKDGVLVLLHDGSLTRTTNFSEMAGKNGLPRSADIEDWTYEQLMQLNLKEATGGSSAKLTPFKIPTLDEVFKVCANRIFVRLDLKDDENDKTCWDYGKDIWPLMQKYESYTNVIYTWHAIFRANNYKLVKEYKKLQEAACGDSAILFIGLSAESGNPSNTLHIIKTHNLDYCVRLNEGGFSDLGTEKYISQNKTILNALKGKARVYIDAHGSSSKYETEKDWAMLNEAGVNLLLVNKGFELCQYISENFEPAQK